MPTDSTLSDSTAWINARVSNTLRSPLSILLIGCTVFVIAIIGLVIVPRQVRRANRPRILLQQRPDTSAAAATAGRIRAALEQADKALASARDSLGNALNATRDTLPPELRARRDSIFGTLGALNRLLARVENAPLPASYRALAQSPSVRGNPRVNTLLDSLTAVERERQDFGASGGVDPIFVALTARVATLGRSITDIAYRERNRLREQIAALRQMQPQRDTLMPSIVARFREMTRDSVRAELTAAEQTLAALRLVHLRTDSATTRARELANVSAPPIAMLTASLVLALFAGFGATLAREMYRPTVASSQEAEKVSGVRVIAVVTRAHLEQADAAAPPSLIDLKAESYRRLYLYLAGSKATLAMVTVTGDDPDIHAVVAANIAAAAGGEGRGTLLVDGDLARSPIAAIFGAPPVPGLAEIIQRKAGWPEALEPIAVARELSLDLVPSGRKGSAEVTSEDSERIRRDLGRMARRYDVMVLNAPLSHVKNGAHSMLPAPDVLLCARIGHTTLRGLTESLSSLRAAGTRIAGLVLWAGEDPRIPVSTDGVVAGARQDTRRPPVSTVL